MYAKGSTMESIDARNYHPEESMERKQYSDTKKGFAIDTNLTGLCHFKGNKDLGKKI